jgi:four helix bundle protein
MSKNIFKEKSFKFSVRIVKAYQYLAKEKNEYVVSKQLLRSGTAIAALHREAEYAESKQDFIHKMGIAQKECNETVYWMELLYATDFLDKGQFESLNKDATELFKLCTSIITSAKKSLITNH